MILLGVLSVPLVRLIVFAEEATARHKLPVDSGHYFPAVDPDRDLLQMQTDGAYINKIYGNVSNRRLGYIVGDSPRRRISNLVHVSGEDSGWLSLATSEKKATAATARNYRNAATQVYEGLETFRHNHWWWLRLVQQHTRCLSTSSPPRHPSLTGRDSPALVVVVAFPFL